MRCIVTGVAGFIGSHLAEALLAEGHEVIGIDDLSTGKRENLYACERFNSFQFIRADVAGFGKISIFERPIDWIFHLAGKADIVPSIKAPMDYHDANVNGTLHMLELARTFKVGKFIYAASSSCYGIPESYPTAEYSELDPRYPYALTKMIGEEYVLHWADVYKIPAVSLRLFNVYGKRSRTSGAYGAVMGVFLAQLANNMPFTVVGDGTQTRDFVHVRDVVRAFILAAKSDRNLAGEAINIGGGDPKSINHLVSLLKEDARVQHIPKRPGEPDCTWADIGKAKALLDWAPQIRFEDGVNEMKESLGDYKRAPLWDPAKIHYATLEWFKALS